MGLFNRKKKRINARKLDEFMTDNPKYQYIDVRTKHEYSQGKIEGFRRIQDSFIYKGQYKLRQEDPVVLVCRSGKRSKKCAKFLRQEGYEVYDIKGGYYLYEKIKNLEAKY